jgi:hypothetical protein
MRLIVQMVGELAPHRQRPERSSVADVAKRPGIANREAGVRVVSRASAIHTV